MNRFRKILKVSLLSVISIVGLLLIFHFWLIAHAKNILAEIVHVQSKGRYQLRVQKVVYDYGKLRLELRQPLLTNVDAGNSSDEFEMHAQSITLQLEKLWPLISGRQLLIDSILMDRPILNLIHQKRTNNQLPKTAFSLSAEMEKLYQSIQSVLTTLKVANFRINKGAFTLNSASQKNATPLEIKNIDFYIKGFNIDSVTLSNHPNSYTEDIQLVIAGQTIYFPDGNKSIQFSSFRFVANKGNLEVDSCTISSGDIDSTKASFNLFAEKMRIKNIFLAVNDSTDYNRIDSLFFTKPTVSFSVQVKDTKQDSSKTIATAIRKITSAAFGRLLVRYVSINNVDFDVEVERKEKLSTFNFVQDSLVISNLGVGLFPSMPLSASSIRFGVKEFVDYFRDSTYLVHFDSVRINNDQFSLFNINIESTARVKKGHQKIYIPVLQINGIDWYQLISQKRLVASNFTLHDPSISIIEAGDSKNKSLKKNGNVDRFLREMFVLKNITIVNGSLNYTVSRTDYLNIKKINTFLTPDLSTPGLMASLKKMIRNFNTGELVFLKDGWKMTARDLIYGEGQRLSAASIHLTNSLRNLDVKAGSVHITGLSNESTRHSLNIKEIAWGNAVVSMNLSKKRAAKTSSILSIGSLNGGPTALKLIRDSIRLEAKISHIKTGGIILENGKPKELQGLLAEGTGMDMIAGNDQFHSGKFFIKDKAPSTLSSVTASFAVTKRPVNVTIPLVSFVTDIQQSLSGALDIGMLQISKPNLAIYRDPAAGTAAPKSLKPFPFINFRNIEVTDPAMSFLQREGDQPLQLGLGSSTFSVVGIKTLDDGSRLGFSDIKMVSKNFTLDNKGPLHISSSNGLVTLSSKALMLYSASSINRGKWELADGSVDLINITLLNKRNSGLTDTLQVRTLYAGNLYLNENTVKNPAAYFAAKPAFTFNNLNVSYHDNNSRINIAGLKGSSSMIFLDSLSYRPQMGIHSFMSSLTFQKDYLTLETGSVSAKDLDIISWVKDSILRIGNIQIDNAVLNARRDKHLPLEPDIIKGLPVTLIKNIPFKTLIDSVSINNSSATYHETSEKTNQTGSIRFTNLNATIRKIKNYDFLTEDSVHLAASAYLMDSAYIQLRLQESYTDSLATFPLVVKAGPFEMKILNPFLLPVMSVRIKSGIVDSIQIRAVGREYLSLGEMLFRYQDLKVEFLKADYDQKKTLLTSLITFAANSFVIRTNNRKRVGKIFYERSRNRSFFNYLVKMVASGAASSVGAKRNQKYNRLYDEKIKELNLPPISY